MANSCTDRMTSGRRDHNRFSFSVSHFSRIHTHPGIVVCVLERLGNFDAFYAVDSRLCERWTWQGTATTNRMEMCTNRIRSNKCNCLCASPPVQRSPFGKLCIQLNKIVRCIIKITTECSPPRQLASTARALEHALLFGSSRSRRIHFCHSVGFVVGQLASAIYIFRFAFCFVFSVFVFVVLPGTLHTKHFKYIKVFKSMFFTRSSPSNPATLLTDGVDFHFSSSGRGRCRW